MIITGFGRFENLTPLLHAQFPKRAVGGEKARWRKFTRDMTDRGARREIFVCVGTSSYGTGTRAGCTPRGVARANIKTIPTAQSPNPLQFAPSVSSP